MFACIVRRCIPKLGYTVTSTVTIGYTEGDVYALADKHIAELREKFVEFQCADFEKEIVTVYE